MSRTRTVPVDLWRLALEDAIEWNQSILDSGNDDPGTKDRLKRFRAALAKLAPRPKTALDLAMEGAPSVELKDLRAITSNHFHYPGDPVCAAKEPPLVARHGGRVIDPRDNRP